MSYACGLQIAPKMSVRLQHLSGQRLFRRAIINFDIEQAGNINVMEILLISKSSRAIY